jgi:hypothetical protein
MHLTSVSLPSRESSSTNITGVKDLKMRTLGRLCQAVGFQRFVQPFCQLRNVSCFLVRGHDYARIHFERLGKSMTKPSINGVFIFIYGKQLFIPNI